MLKFCFLEKSQQWAVTGPADEVKLGFVEVTRGNGDVKTERIVKVTKEYERDGEMRRLGFITPLPWKA
jgi:hypothetical protein